MNLSKEAEKLAKEETSQEITPKSIIHSDKVQRAVGELKQLAMSSGDKIAENVGQSIQAEGAEDRLYKAIKQEFAGLLKKAKKKERRRTISRIKQKASTNTEAHEKLNQALSELNIPT